MPNRDQGSLMGVMRPEKKHHWRPGEFPNLDGVDELGADFEADGPCLQGKPCTGGLRWWDDARAIGLSLAWGEGADERSFYLPWGHVGGNVDPEKAKAWIRDTLRYKKLYWINGSYDINLGHASGIDFEEMECWSADVGFYAALLDDHRMRFNLDSISKEYLGYGKKELPQGSIEHMSQLHAGEAEEYARHDALLNWRLRQKMWPMIQEEELEEVAELEEEVIYATCAMERAGAPIDVPKLERWCNEVEQIRMRLLTDIQREVGFRFEPTHRDSKLRLFRELGLENPFRTEKKQEESFTADILSSFDHPTVQKWYLYNLYTSLDNKFLTGYRKRVDRNGILRYSLHQMACEEGGTVSGRYSSSRMTASEGINVQQVTKPSKQKTSWKNLEKYAKLAPYIKEFIVRELFIPQSGHWFSSDARQIEYRLFAHYANTENILQKYRENPLTDFHAVVMEMVQKTKQINRDRTKDLNFAKIYGAGIKKIAWMLGFRRANAPESSDEGVAQAKPFVEAYDKEFPEAKALLYEASQIAEKRGYVKTVLGRRARFIRGAFSHKALNRVIQGGAADIAKKKSARLHATRKETGLKLRFPMHDEFCGDIPDRGALEKVAKILDEQDYDLRVPILWDTRMGPNWKEAA